MSSKYDKTKGGKPKAGLSAMASAEEATAQTCAELMEHPETFVVFRVAEVIGVPKAGAQDFLIRATRADGVGGETRLIVPEVFLKKRGKKVELLMPEMGLHGALLVVKPKHVTRERMAHVSNGGFGGAQMKVKVAELDMIVAGAMVVDPTRPRELPPTVVGGATPSVRRTPTATPAGGGGGR
jgi:hypothetical protein